MQSLQSKMRQQNEKESKPIYADSTNLMQNCKFSSTRSYILTATKKDGTKQNKTPPHLAFLLQKCNHAGGFYSQQHIFIKIMKPMPTILMVM